MVGNASPQCPLERAPWSILTHWCCDKRFSTNRSSFNDKNYISTHHIDHESAAICPANCGLSFSLASCSLIFGKLKGQLCCPSMMILHAPTITPKPPAGSCCSENGFTEWTFHSKNLRQPWLRSAIALELLGSGSKRMETKNSRFFSGERSNRFGSKCF